MKGAACLGFAAALAAYGFAVSWFCGVGLEDEAWFLQVTQRVLGGEVLYRDVFLGVTPLSLYASVAVAAVLGGAEVLALKALVAATFAATVVLSLRIARALAIGPLRRTLVVIAILALGAPRPGALYGPLATTCTLACAGACLAFLERRARRDVLVAAAAAALAFLAKQNVGLMALLLVLAVVGCTDRTQVPAVALAFLGVLVLGLAPVVWQGALDDLFFYGFRNKGVYLAHAGTASGELLAPLWNLVRHPRLARIEPAALTAWLVAVLVGFLTLPAAWRRAAPGGRAGLVIGGSLALIAVLGIAPRFDVPHLGEIVPAGALLLAAVAPAVGPRVEATAGVVFMALAGAGRFVPLVLAGLSGLRVVSHLEHVRGGLFAVSTHREVEAVRGRLRELDAHANVFLMTPRAGLGYLVSGRPNPTPFDYPLRTTMGSRGQNLVRERIASGAITDVCLVRGWGGPLSPLALEAFVTHTMTPRAAWPNAILFHGFQGLADEHDAGTRTPQ